MKTTIIIDGAPYNFVTENGITKLKIQSETTPNTNNEPEKVSVPNIWLITRTNGTPLFALQPLQNESFFRVMTADKLYSEKIQWFEPLADNFRKLMWQHPESTVQNSEPYMAYKHFSWRQIINFSIIDRWSVSFSGGFSGDWKSNSEGGDGFLMVLVEEMPYWTDAIGQIPFAVDTYRKFFEELRSKPAAIRKCVNTGIDYGDGHLIGSTADKTNTYDNFMVLRGALWASENFQITITKRVLDTPNTTKIVEDATTQYIPTSAQPLHQPVSIFALAEYGEWQK